MRLITLLAAASGALVIGHPFAAEVTSRSSDYEYDAPPPGSYTLPAVRSAGDGEVLDSEGRALRLRDLTRGRITVMSFIYTRCAAAKACPYATGVLRELHQLSESDAELANQLRLVSIS